MDRRKLIRAAAGGFAFAASGLLVPGRLIEEVGAADHPVRRLAGRKDRQRDTRRRRLEHRRGVNRRQDENTGSAPGRDTFSVRGINFLVAFSGQQPIKGDFYVPRDRRGRPDFWDLKESKSVAPSAEGSFASANPQSALWLDDRILVDANNWDVFPRLKVGSGGAFRAGSVAGKAGRSCSTAR